ncbi:MAG TPA: nitroreductase family protein [Candidatus Nitrosocosmicus sp.]|nr:nitroreductase family protein [Candidatus Nitrosocosmicus sp.]
MNTRECIATKLDIREFSSDEVSTNSIKEILESARKTGSGLNTQHWRFILVREKDNLKKLSDASTSGQWIIGANFAIIILTDPKYSFHLLDAGRLIQNMQLSAWDEGIGSGIYTGVIPDQMRKHFNLPSNLNISAVLGFGYPKNRIKGNTKNRKSIEDISSIESYGRSIKEIL